MNKIEGLEIKRIEPASDPLPAGGYVAKILDAEEKEYSCGSVLVISFDILEGEFKDFFKQNYKANTREDKKWKGVYRLTVPQESNQWYDSQKRTFGNAIACIEESNNGYHWNWDEKTLKGKTVGVLFRNFEYDVEGNTGWSTECCSLASVEDIREGNFKMPKDKPLKKKAVAMPVTPVQTFEEIQDEDLPF